MVVESQQAQRALRPTSKTLALRSSFLWQLFRFVVINLRMTAMILKSHHTRIPRSARQQVPARAE